MFDYPVMTEEQAMKERFQLMPDGEYDAVIKKCEAKMSSSNNHMFDMTLDVYDDNGKPSEVRDFLVFSPKMMWKIIHCADSAGLSKEYEEKKLCPELLVGKGVRVKIVYQEGSVIPVDKLKGKPFGSTYPAKNAVDDYVKRDPNAVIAKPAAKAGDKDFIDDDLPF